MLQQCGCQDFEPRIVHCEHGYMAGPDLPDVECCCCSLNPCEAALYNLARVFIDHVRADSELSRLHSERAVRYALAHGEREAVPF